MRPSMRRECVDHVVVLDEATFSLNGEAPRGSGRSTFRAGLIIPMINSWQLGVATAKRRTADFDSDAEVRILPPQPGSAVSGGHVSLARICATFPRVIETMAGLRRAFFWNSGNVRRISCVGLWP